jgi:hypothetical protein
MSLVLQSSGGGSVTIAEPTTASNFTQTLQAATGTIANIDQLGNGFRNRIINGAMTFDQRNNGASVSATNGLYTLDRYVTTSFSGGPVTNRFTVQRDAGAVTPPAGFIDYLGVTSSASTSVGPGDIYAVTQAIEGLNISDLSWGTANAKTITLSFWVRSSLTGNFGGALNNDAGNYNFPFQYTISSANTWEYKTVTIIGPTTSTWLTTNGVGVYLRFGLGGGTTWSEPAGSWTANLAYTADSSVNVVSTNGATWYITGLQFEVGSTATPFDFRSIGTELALCQRYYSKITTGSNTNSGLTIGLQTSTTAGVFNLQFPVSMRAAPTVSSNNLIVSDNSTLDSTVTTLGSVLANPNTGYININFGAMGAQFRPMLLRTANGGTTGFIDYSAEL